MKVFLIIFFSVSLHNTILLAKSNYSEHINEEIELLFDLSENDENDSEIEVEEYIFSKDEIIPNNIEFISNMFDNGIYLSSPLIIDSPPPEC